MSVPRGSQGNPGPRAAPDAAWSAEPGLPPGHLLDGRYLIREIVDRSGMATIYRAEDVECGGATVAIKMPRAKIESDPAGFAQFIREGELGARFSHPSLVKIQPAPERPSRPYLVLEFLTGQTLARRLQRSAPLSEGEALKIAAGVCDALGHMHERGVVHRDLKPSNIMLCDDGTLRLFDFGLAAPPQRQRSVLARLTSIFGTPEYMAPEQVDNAAIDERTDLYGLGAILYEMLTGEVVFRRDGPWASAFARTSGDPVAPRKLNPRITPQAEEIVLHALQRDPAERYPTAAAFRQELEAPGRVVVTGHAERLVPPRWRLSIQGTPILAGTILGVGTVLALAGLFFLLRFVLPR